MAEVALEYFSLSTWSLTAQIPLFALFGTNLFLMRNHQWQTKCWQGKSALHNYRKGLGKPKLIPVLPVVGGQADYVFFEALKLDFRTKF